MMVYKEAGKILSIDILVKLSSTEDMEGLLIRYEIGTGIKTEGMESEELENGFDRRSTKLAR